MIWISKHSIRKLLPFYLNGTLSKKEKGRVEKAMDKDAYARGDLSTWTSIKSSVIEQPRYNPSPLVWDKLLTAVQMSREKKLPLLPLWRSFLVGTIMAIFMMAALWFVIRPGVMLDWSVQHEGMVGYKLYRADLGSTQFKLIKVVTARIGQQRYSYTDILLLPGKDYVYRVEAIPATGNPVYSQEVSGKYLEILPGQAALLITSIIFGYGMAFVCISRLDYFGPKPRSNYAM